MKNVKKKWGLAGRQHLLSGLMQARENSPSSLSVVHEDRADNWETTHSRVARLAGALKNLTTETGGRTAILGHNGPEYFELSHAVPWAGQVYVPINERFSKTEVYRLLEDCPSEVLVFGEGFVDQAEAVSGLVRKSVYWGARQHTPDFAEHYEDLTEASFPVDPIIAKEDDIWAVIFTGGTTGSPKGVLLSHRAMEFNIASIEHHMNWDRQPRFLQVSPLFHLAGLGASFVVTSLAGTHHFLPQFTIDGLYSVLENNRITATVLVPTMIGWLVNHPERAKFDLSALRFLGYGASTIQQATLEKLLSQFDDIRLTQFYGQTEVCGGLSALEHADHSLEKDKKHRLKSAGRPSKGTSVRIQSEDGKLCAVGEWGEICGQTPAIFGGYLGQPELTSRTVQDGWLHTGDIGYLDEDGYLYITDRLKDMIVTGGENVASNEVENVLAQHPDIVQVAVIGVDDAEWGERVHAVCVTRPGVKLTHSQIKDFCAEHIANYKCPKTSSISSDPLPVSALGKVRKDILRKKFGSENGKANS